MRGLDRGFHAGLAVVRLAAWAWLAVAAAVQADRMSRPWLAVALVAATLAWSIVAGLARRWLVAGDVAVAVALLAADRHVYDEAHPQHLAGVWPLAAPMAAGFALGPVAGAAAGAVLGAFRWLGDGSAPPLSAVSSTVFYMLTGAAAGFLAGRLRAAESEVAAARAREEVARTLHDGVLQTLAVVQRRSEDGDLVRLAREQERELREWLFGTGAGGPGPSDLVAALRAAAHVVEDRAGLRTTVVVADDADAAAAGLGPDVVAALAGAVREALTNAAKHGSASRATIYVEAADDGGLFCSVKDDGAGFDPAATVEGVGIARSIRARIAEVGGMVEIDGNPGHGAEVRIAL